MTRVALWVAYDGTEFRGFAPNLGVPTVTAVLEEGLRTVLRSTPSLTCAGRTDAGVHGRWQVVTFDVADEVGLDLHGLERSLNGLCRPAVSVWHTAIVPETFDARFSAKSRTYRYTILNQRVPDPLRRHQAWHVWDVLDLERMNEAVALIIGTRDFSSFCRRKFVKTPAGDEVEAPRVRTLLRAEWTRSVSDPAELTLEIEATSFCQQMVRSIVGTCVDVGRNRLEVADMTRILAAQDRLAAGTVAPPQGLVLWHVAFDEADLGQPNPPAVFGHPVRRQ